VGEPLKYLIQRFKNMSFSIVANEEILMKVDVKEVEECRNFTLLQAKVKLEKTNNTI
jgi:hypothetical protein